MPILLMGNKIDSLERVAKQHFIENDKVAQIEAYKELADAYAADYEHEKAQSSYQTALKLAQELKRNDLIFELLNEIGLMHFWLDHYLQALEVLQNAQSIDTQNIPEKSIATNFSRIAEVFISLGMYDQAFTYQEKSLMISRQINDQPGLGDAYRILSRIYWYQQEPIQAEQELIKALEIYERLGQKKYIYTCYAALSSIYVETEEINKALEYAEKSLKIAEEISYPYGKAFSTGLIGAGNKRLGKMELAEKKLQDAIEQFQEIDIVYEATDFQVLMAELLSEQKDYTSAIDLLHQLDSIAKYISALQLEADVQEALASNYASVGDLNKAYLHQKTYTILKDSLFGKEKLSQMTRLESKYKLEQQAQEAEIEARDLQINREKWFLFVYSGLLILCLVLMGNIYRRYKAIQNQQLSLNSSHTDVMKAYQKLHNDHIEMRRMAGLLSSEINNVVVSLKKRGGQLENPGRADTGILKGENETRKLNQLLVGMEVYRTIEGDETRESFTISEIIPEAIEHLPEALVKKAKRIRLQNLPEITANRTQITQLFEHLLSNAIKFNETQYPEITISGEEGNEFFLIKVQDKGIGIPRKKQEKVFDLFYTASDMHEGSGAGLALAKKIVEQHKGKIWLTSEEGNGTTVFVKLPK